MAKEPNELDYRTRLYKRYATFFQGGPETFSEEVASRWSAGYRYYLRNWLPADKNAVIADVACGGGRLLYLFKQMQYPNIAGVDISPEQVKLARQVTPTIYEANILDWLEANPVTFDLITGLDIIEHFNKSEVLRFLDNIYTALKPHGQIIIQTQNAKSPWGGSIRYGDFTHEVGFTVNGLSQLLRLMGFQNVESREIGPVPRGYSALSSLRFLIWQFIRMGLKIWNLAEIGSVGSGVYTRVFLIKGCKDAGI